MIPTRAPPPIPAAGNLVLRTAPSDCVNIDPAVDQPQAEGTPTEFVVIADSAAIVRGLQGLIEDEEVRFRGAIRIMEAVQQLVAKMSFSVRTGIASVTKGGAEFGVIWEEWGSQLSQKGIAWDRSLSTSGKTSVFQSRSKIVLSDLNSV